MPKITKFDYVSLQQQHFEILSLKFVIEDTFLQKDVTVDTRSVLLYFELNIHFE